MSTARRAPGASHANDETAPAIAEAPSRKANTMLAVASRLFLERGFDPVTMDAVAREAAVSKATLYAHFKSKEALFAAVVAMETARIDTGIWPSSPGGGGDVAGTLRQVARNYHAVFMNEQTFLMQRAIIGAMAHHPSLGRFVLEAGPDAFLDKIAVFLAAADKAGRVDVPNPKLAAAQFLSLASCDVRTTGFLSLEMPSDAEIRERIEGAVGMFMAYYGRKSAEQGL